MTDAQTSPDAPIPETVPPPEKALSGQGLPPHTTDTSSVRANAKLAGYRDHLIKSEANAQDSFAKTLLTLSGGAIGISFAFLGGILGAGPYRQPNLLSFSWLCWILSLTFVLASIYTSVFALRRAIRQVDNGTIYRETPGGRFGSVTDFLNAASALSFLAGVVSMTVFVFRNFQIG